MTRSPVTTPAGAEERALSVAFAARVAELRAQRRLSQEQLAVAAGISASWLGRVESAPRSITLGLVQRLCGALEVSHDELLGGLPKLTERYSRANRRRYVRS
jgi:transcriptional regulator with XRE-family HTH domain